MRSADCAKVFGRARAAIDIRFGTQGGMGSIARAQRAGGAAAAAEPSGSIAGPGEHRRRAGPAVDPVPAGAIRVSRATGFQLLLFRRWHANSLDGAGDRFRLLERQHERGRRLRCLLPGQSSVLRYSGRYRRR